MWEDIALDGLIAETTDIDYKVALEETKPKSWLKSVCAFANGDGGILAFGVDDNGVLVGLHDPQHVAEKVSELVNVRIDPIPVFRIKAVEKDRARIVLLKVESGVERPYVYVGDGTQIVYVRCGNQSLPASSAQLRRLAMQGSHIHFDEIETTLHKDDYSFEVLRASYFERTGERFEDADFTSFGLARSDGRLTNAGILLADQPILRQNRVFCTRWNGLDKAKADSEVLDDHEYSGCLVRLLREAMDFVGRHNRIGWAKADYDRIESPSYVMRAVEEALVNAFIHRQYEIGGAEVTVFAFDDRLEITSPGSKVDGPLSEDVDLDTIESIRRNPSIADLFQRMRYMERKGSGLKLIRERTAFAPNYEERFLPRFIDDGKNFKVVLWNMNYQTPQDTPQDTPQVATLLTALGNETLSLALLMERLGLSDRKNFREFYLNPALESQKVEMTIPEKPTSRNQRYRAVRNQSIRESNQEEK